MAARVCADRTPTEALIAPADRAEAYLTWSSDRQSKAAGRILIADDELFGTVLR